jgi:hypothetical protein
MTTGSRRRRRRRRRMMMMMPCTPSFKRQIFSSSFPSSPL